MKRLFTLLSILIIVIVLYSCSSNSPDDFFEEIAEGEEVPLVTFNTDVNPIIQNSCVECHTGPGAEAGLQLENFEQVVNGVQNRGLLNRIVDVDNPMPPTGLLPSQVTDIIIQWSEDGLLEE